MVFGQVFGAGARTVFENPKFPPPPGGLKPGTSFPAHVPTQPTPPPLFKGRAHRGHNLLPGTGSRVWSHAQRCKARSSDCSFMYFVLPVGVQWEVFAQ